VQWPALVRRVDVKDFDSSAGRLPARFQLERNVCLAWRRLVPTLASPPDEFPAGFRRSQQAAISTISSAFLTERHAELSPAELELLWRSTRDCPMSMNSEDWFAEFMFAASVNFRTASHGMRFA
jgi:hypothetical protein